MSYTPIASFRRQVEAVHLDCARMAAAPLPQARVDKWEVLRDLTDARTALGLKDRPLTVLQALLSFHPDRELSRNASLVVFPSNAAICARLNGMPCSTMRRHLATLVAAGLLIRRDSPNGKRYVRRAGERETYGFDLRPLLLRADDIASAAETARETARAMSRIRREASLMCRDITGLAKYGARLRPDLSIWDRDADRARLIARTLRRSLDLFSLRALHTELAATLKALTAEIDVLETPVSSTNAREFEQHLQDSDKTIIDSDCGTNSESTAEDVRETRAGSSSNALNDHPVGDESVAKNMGKDRGPASQVNGSWRNFDAEAGASPSCSGITLEFTLSVLSELRSYVTDPPSDWYSFVQAVGILRPMMDISASAWDEAKSAMGPVHSAIVVGAMLQRLSDIRSPGAYLRHLARRANAGQFSVESLLLSIQARRETGLCRRNSQATARCRGREFTAVNSLGSTRRSSQL